MARQKCRCGRDAYYYVIPERQHYCERCEENWPKIPLKKVLTVTCQPTIFEVSGSDPDNPIGAPK